jgi:outer membrane protein insertion porin family
VYGLVLLVLLIFSPVDLCVAYPNLKDRPVNSINIESEPFINQKEMKWLIDLKRGDPFSEKKVQSGIKRLYLKKFFSNIIVNVEKIDGMVDVTFTLIPKTRVIEINFKGHDYFWKSELKHYIYIREYDELNERKLEKSVKKLMYKYKEEGFFNVSIDYEINDLKNQYDKEVVFNIREGEQAAIESISVDFPYKKLDKEEILSVIDLEPGDRFSKNDLRKEVIPELEEYLIENGYYDLEELKYDYDEGENIDLKFTIGVKSRVKINFIGNEEFSDKKLFSYFDFSKQKSSKLNVIKGFVKNIEKLYKDNGYYFVKISIDEPGGGMKDRDKDDYSDRTINVHISEGKKVVVTEVWFDGNEKYSDERLTKQMLTRKSGVILDEYLVQRLLDIDDEVDEYADDDINALEFLYYKNGYLDVNVTYEKLFNEEQDEVEIIITIKEGEPTMISKIGFEGVSEEHLDAVKSIVLNKEGALLNIYRIEDDKRLIKDYYNKLGYYRVDVETDPDLLPEIKYIVDEGIKARIGKLIISNNDFTKKKVIRREAGLKRGDPYVERDLPLAQQRISRLGLFKDVKTIKSVSEEDDEVKDLLIEVEEKDCGAIEFGFGYATEEKLRGFLELRHINLGGYGRTASARAGADSKSRKFTLFFEEPWLFNHPYNATIHVSDEYIKEESFTERKFATAVGINKDFTEYTKGVLQYTIEVDRLSSVESEAVLIPEDVGTHRIHAISPYVVRDTRDNPFNPSRGSINSLRLDYAGREVGSQLRYQKFTGRSSHYFSLRRNIILALSVRGGYGFSLGDEPELPINKRFFLGGRNTVRGFAPDAIGPKGATDVPIGGNVMANYNAEFRISFGNTWGGILFYDAGNVWKETKDFDALEVRDAVGVGVRLITPVGPLSLDIGRKLDRKPGEPSTEWYFTIGNIF